MKKIFIIKLLCVGILLALYFLTRYFHSFYSAAAQGYGSGDAYRVILSAYNVGSTFDDVYMVSYFYKMMHELTGISYYSISFYFTPLIGLAIVFLIFDIVRRELGFFQAMFATLVVILNPWLAYHSTEPSKEIFVLLFCLLSFYFLLRFEKTHLYRWLVSSFLSFSVGITYYHSLLIFFPFYLVCIIYFITRTGDKSIKTIFSSLAVFFGLVLVIAGPQYIIKEIHFKNTQSDKPAYLKTDVDTQGNIFQRQFGAMSYAIFQDREKLGMSKLSEGVDTFIENHVELKYLFLFVLLLSFYIFKYKKNYIPLLFSLLTIYTFIIIGLQWTSYSHSSRYPQYIIYFFLLCSTLPIGWAISVLNDMKVKIIILSLLVILLFSIFAPFTQIDSYRNIYNPHKSIGTKALASGIIINQSNQILYLGWPSITLSLLENYKLKDESYLNTFGWELINLEGVTSKRYIHDKHITYFIYNETGSDYVDSNKKVYELLKKQFTLTPKVYITDDKKSIVIYRIH